MSFFSFFDRQPAAPRAERVRHQVRQRALQVQRLQRLSPGMLRITFAGEALADFVSLAPDDHVKLLLPTPSGEVVRRDYTPRRYDPIARTLAIDFAIHDAGPATRWALGARLGDVLHIVGPKSSSPSAPQIRRWLLVGDETGLPAIGRRIEEAAAGVDITSVVAVAGQAEQQQFHSAARVSAWWAHRPLSMANDPVALLDMVRTVVLTPETFVWIAAEARVARHVRNLLVDELGHPTSWLKAGGYWVAGKADAHERIAG
ncbi:putative siderophore interacting protein [Janthinobacterium sp. HH01]|uniref:siderophore-interacting protein n=1 Tax=Janthinobacterium sp. HH01 TaxID=1198452 RepID=UPI0002AED175|nr:siderophore-interacting protein [Janthinobacterium sp. HH01]ELX13521.1 putative siderophore interacting protein [Janthinobacterium sp. HH01]